MLENAREWIVEWGDCDPAGIVFFPRFLAAFDTSTSRLIELAAGKRKAVLDREHDIIGWPMVDLQVRFGAPARNGDKTVIHTTVTRVGTSSIGFAHKLTLDGVLCVEANEVRVWSGPDAEGRLTGKPIPDYVARALRGE